MPRLLSHEQIRNSTREALHEFQDRKFASYARTLLASCSPYYARLFAAHGVAPGDFRGVASWRDLGLPLVRKDAFRHDPDAFVLGMASDGEAGAVHAYHAYAAEVGGLPAAVPIRSFPGLEAVHAISHPWFTGAAPASPSGYEALFGRFGVFLSGGSTGVPVPVRHSRLDRDLYQIATKRLHAALVEPLHESGSRVSATTLYPQAPHMGFWMTTWGLEAVSHSFLTLSGGGVLPTERLAELALRYQVNVLAGIPSYFRNRFLPALVDASRASRLPMPPDVAISLGGEPVTERCIADVRAALHDIGARRVQVVGGYGASESRFSLWYECQPGSGYHCATPDLAAARIVRMNDDGSWDFVDDGEEGLLVLFPLEGTGTVLAGFVMGDSARMTHEVCPHCGFRGPRLLDVGRLADVAAQQAAMGTVELKIRGATVNLEDVRSRLLDDPDVQEVQLVIRKRIEGDPDSQDVLLVRVAVRRTAPDGEEVGRRVVRLTKHVSEVTPSVEVVAIEQLLGSGIKFQPIVEQRY